MLTFNLGRRRKHRTMSQTSNHSPDEREREREITLELEDQTADLESPGVQAAVSSSSWPGGKWLILLLLFAMI